MVQITAEDIFSFGAAERVSLIEGDGVQKVVCHHHAGTRRSRHVTTDEITIHRLTAPSSAKATARPSRSLDLNRQQMVAWRHLCSKLRGGDRLTLAWEDTKWPRRRTTVTVLVTRAGRLRHYHLGEARGGRRALGIAIRPGRLALVVLAAVGLWWLTRHHPVLAVVVAALLLLGLVAHRRRARDGWPLGTVRWLRFLAVLAVTAMPVLLTVLAVVGVVYGVVRITRWARNAWRHANGAGWGRATPARSWRVDRHERGPLIDMEPDADGVHRRRAADSNDTRGNVVPLQAANSPEAYAVHAQLGAAELDVVAPGWEPLVDAELLARAADPGALILEAVFGSYDAGLRAVLDHLNSKRAGVLEDCMRAALTGDTCSHIGDRPEAVHQRALRAAWCDELADRARDHAPAS